MKMIMRYFNLNLTFQFSCLTVYKITLFDNTIPDLDQSAGLAEDAPDCLHASGALTVHHGHPVLILECFIHDILSLDHILPGQWC